MAYACRGFSSGIRARIISRRSRYAASEGWNDVFFDLDPDRGIAPSERWERALHAAATRCEAVIFLASANWLASGSCRKEYALARSLNKKLFVVLIDLAKPIHDILPELKGTWHVVNLVGGQELQLSRTLLPDSHEEKHVGFTTDGLRRLKRGLENAGLDPMFFAWPPEREPASAQFRGAVAGAQGVAGRMGQGAGSCRLRRRQRVARSPITAIKSDDGRAVGSRGRRSPAKPAIEIPHDQSRLRPKLWQCWEHLRGQSRFCLGNGGDQPWNQIAPNGSRRWLL